MSQLFSFSRARRSDLTLVRTRTDKLFAVNLIGWEGKSLKSLQGFFPSGSRHVLLSGTKVVELGDGFVYVDCSHPELGFPSERIEFDASLLNLSLFSSDVPAHPRFAPLSQICVLAIGSLYPFPMRPHSTTLIEAKQSYLESQIKIKGFQNIVLVGGGACSIEYAGVSFATRRSSLPLCPPSLPEEPQADS